MNFRLKYRVNQLVYGHEIFQPGKNKQNIIDLCKYFQLVSCKTISVGTPIYYCVLYIASGLFVASITFCTHCMSLYKNINVVSPNVRIVEIILYLIARICWSSFHIKIFICKHVYLDFAYNLLNLERRYNEYPCSESLCIIRYHFCSLESVWFVTRLYLSNLKRWLG